MVVAHLVEGVHLKPAIPGSKHVMYHTSVNPWLCFSGSQKWLSGSQKWLMNLMSWVQFLQLLNFFWSTWRPNNFRKMF